MKQLFSACDTVLCQLEQTVLDIEPGDFTKPSEALSGSSIGQHLRHSLELFMCLEKGYHSGIVNYDDRPRDKRIETDKIAAVQAIRQIRKFLQLNRTDRLMRLEISPDLGNSQPIAIETTLFRELAYNIDHIVHHLAIIKIGLKEVAPYICLPEHFGVAASTIRHQKEQHAVGSR